MYYKHFILVLILMLLSVSVSAEKIARFHSLSLEDGLPSKTVRAIAQDSQGFVWFGTTGGLARYDGFKSLTFSAQPKSTNVLSGNNIRALHNSKDGILWIATYAGLNQYNPTTQQFNTYRHNSENHDSLASDRVYAVMSDELGFLWIGTDNGLDRMNISNNQIIHFTHHEDDKASLPDNKVFDLLLARSGDLWVATAKGVVIYQQASGLFKTVNLPKGILVKALHEDRNGIVWIGTYSGLYFYNSVTNTIHIYADNKNEIFFKNNKIYAINSDLNGNVWLGGSKTGLCKINIKNSVICFRYDKGAAHSIRDNTILSITRDSSEQLWIGTYDGGVHRLDLPGLQFGLDDFTSGARGCLIQPKVNAILVENRTIHWFGTQDGLVRLDLFSGDCQLFTQEPDQAKLQLDGAVYSVFRDSRGLFWVGSGHGLIRLNESTNTVEHLQNKIPTTLTSFIGEDRNGQLFVATDKKVYQYYPNSDSFAPIKPIDPQLDSEVWSFVFDSEDNMWIGTETGLAFRPAGAEYYDYVRANGLPVVTNVVGAMHLDVNKANLWVGVDDIGLILFDRDGHELTRYTKKDGLPSLKFSYIAIDETNKLWITTSLGLVNIDPSTRQLKSYQEKDGLQGSFFMQNAGFQSKDGLLTIGGNKGVNSFYPKDIKETNAPAKVVLTNLYRFTEQVIPGQNYAGFVLPKPLSEVDELILTHQEYVFSIEFIGLHFADPVRNSYAFKMQGVDPDWNYTDASSRKATYTNLPPGNYIFKVKSSNKEGTWNLDSTELKVLVLPPWWLTWWAFTLYGLTFISFILIWYKWRMALIVEHTLELEREVDSRTLELSQRNVDVQKLLKAKDTLMINISHEFKTPLTVLYGAFEFINSIALKGNEALKAAKLNNQVQHMMRLVDQLLQLSRLDNSTDIKREPINLSLCLEQLIPMYDSSAKILNVELRVSIESDLIVFAEKTSFEHVFTNLISNAIKYNRRDGFVEIYAYSSEQQCVVSINDSGIGIAPENKEKIFKRFGKLNHQQQLDHQVLSTGLGLAIVKQAVELNFGQLELASEPGVGSCFKVKFPISEFKQNLITEFATSPIIEQIPELNFAHTALSETFIDENKNTILIIEDVAGVAEYIVETLSTDYNTLVAHNGEKGLELAAEYLPDLILSDIMMPGIDGFEVLQTLKSQEITAYIPVILLTAMGDVGALIRGFELQADDYLEKPFSPDELRLRIRTKLEYRDILRRRFDLSAVITENTKSDENDSGTDVKIFDVALIESSTKKAFIIKINHWLDKHIDQEIKTTDLADHLAMSSKQLGRKLKQITAFNSVEYIRSYRLVKAYERLPTETNIANLAYDLGFSSQNYFANAFKAYFGIRPKERQQGIEAQKGTLM